jgi:hypothetical protein
MFPEPIASTAVRWWRDFANAESLTVIEVVGMRGIPTNLVTR